ncbi:MAG: hypothetical protein NVS3B10_10390 [Polyangiales bacterium]
MSAHERKKRALLAQLMVLCAVMFGAALAFAQADGSKAAAPTGAPSASSSASSSASTAPSAKPIPSGVVEAAVYTSGVSPVPNGNVPKDWLPPGADDPDLGPSMAIFPAQHLTLRFNHKKHVQGQNLKCVYCHSQAPKSTSSTDMLIPFGEKAHGKCNGCHAIDAADPLKDAAPGARCDFCHLGSRIENGVVQIAKLEVPTPNLKMSHKAHLDKGFTCEQCHGMVGELELATRDQMPRMKGCFGCHNSGDAGGFGGAAGAKSACLTCHLADKSGVQLQTMTATGVLMPPKWLKNSKHGVDWIERHKNVAGVESNFCGNCHRESECVDCHDGKKKPLSVHPNDWLNMHEVAARFDQPKCSTCHSTTNFCVPCHTRVGVALSSPDAVAVTARFHPPTWVGDKGVRKPGDHSFEAEKNINACVSCHVERDCVKCHGTQGVGGASNDPHPAKFINKCSTMYAKNPRPCFVCHDVYDKNLDMCR